jgi:hypothetical protein
VDVEADVAQSAEQLICNQQVIGSSPIVGSIFHAVRQGVTQDASVTPCSVFRKASHKQD